MLLSLDILADALQSRYSVCHLGKDIKTLSLHRPYPYMAGTGMKEGRLYIARAAVLPKKLPASMPEALICLGPQLPPCWAEGDCPVLLLSDTEREQEVFVAVQEIFDEFDRWDDQIRRELEKNEDYDLRRVIDAGVRMLGNPICASNQFLQYIFTSELHTRSDGSMDVTVNDFPTPLPLDGLNSVRDYSSMEKRNRKPYLTAAPVPNPPETRKTYCFNLYPMNRFAGCIYVKEICHPFRPGDYQLADYFFDCFSKAYLKYLYRARPSEKPENDLLTRLMSGEQLSPEECTLLSLRPGESWRCFRLRERRGAHCMPRDYMCALLSTMLPQNVYMPVRPQELIGVLRVCEASDALPGDSFSLFGELLEQMDYMAGFSCEFTDISRLKQYMPQTTWAVNTLIKKGSAGPYALFDNGLLDYLLSACMNEFPPDTIYSAGLKRLMEHDRRKGTDYIRTLQIYLKNEMNITKSAEELFVHRTSMHKRLEHLQQLLGNNLEDEDYRLYLRICLRMMQRSENIL